MLQYVKQTIFKIMSHNTELFVIKSDDFYMMLHENKKDISPCCTSIEGAMKYTKEEVNFIYDNFNFRWNRDKYEVHKIKLSSERFFDWKI